MFYCAASFQAVFSGERDAITFEEQGGINPKLVWSLGGEEAFRQKLLEAPLKTLLAHIYSPTVQPIMGSAAGWGEILR